MVDAALMRFSHLMNVDMEKGADRTTDRVVAYNEYLIQRLTCESEYFSREQEENRGNRLEAAYLSMLQDSLKLVLEDDVTMRVPTQSKRDRAAAPFWEPEPELQPAWLRSSASSPSADTATTWECRPGLRRAGDHDAELVSPSKRARNYGPAALPALAHDLAAGLRLV
jgi:hypothetical protein